MLCPKCGIENEEGLLFCKNCNEQLLITDISNSNIENIDTNNKKIKLDKKLVIIIAAIAFVLIVAILLIVFLTNKDDSKSSFKDPFIKFSTKGYKKLTTKESSSLSNVKFINDDVLIPESMSNALYGDFNSGKISADEYVKQALYSIYEPDKLNPSYKSLSVSPKLLDDIIEFASDNVQSLSDETILYIANKYYMVDTGNISAKSTSNYNSDYVVRKLGNEGSLTDFDSALLSPNGNFIIYYSTKGSNSITKKYAENVASILEETVTAYKNKYGYDFKFELADTYRIYVDSFFSAPVLTNDAINTLKWYRVITSSNIPKEKIKTSMPVYIIDFKNNVQGKYTNRALGDKRLFFSAAQVMCKLNPTFNSECSKLSNLNEDADMVINMLNTMYMAPNFVVDSNSSDEDIKIVSMHELFHHYQNTHICNTGSCQDSFVGEASANLAVVQNFYPNNLSQTLLNGHSVVYSKDSAKSIDKQREGYPAYIFLYNYATMVKDGTSIAFNAEKSSNPLLELYNKSGGKYKDVMVKTAGGNLTLDYRNKLLIPYLDDKGIYLPEDYKKYNYNQDISDTQTIDYSSSHYYYIKPYVDIDTKTQVTISASNMDSGKNITVVLYGRNDSQKSFTEIYKQDLDKEFVLTPRDFTGIYGELAIMIVNTSYNANNQYSYNVTLNGTKETLYDVPKKKEDKNDDSFDLGISEGNLMRAKSIYCEKTEPTSSLKQTSEVLVNYKGANRITNLYVKETLDATSIDKSNPLYSMVTTLLDASLQGVEQLFNVYFKNAKTIYTKNDSKYTLTIKVPNEYFDNLGDVYNFKGNRKIDIIKGLTEDGFTCYLQY